MEERAGLESRLNQVESEVRCCAACQPATDECIDLLTRSRTALDDNRHEEARSLLLQVECRVRRAKASGEAIKRHGLWIGLYEGLLAAVLVYLAIHFWSEMVTRRGIQYLGWTPIASCAIWGALGGCIAGLYGLYTHALQRDFDSGFIPFYLAKPVVGLAMGPLMFLFIRAGLMLTQGTPTSRVMGKPIQTIQGVEIIYLGAFLLGFAERFWVRLLDRVASAVFGDAGPSAPTVASTIPARPKDPGKPPAPALPLTVPAAPAGASLRVTVEGPSPDDAGDISATLTRGSDYRKVKGPPPDEGLTFTFDGLSPGSYELIVSKPGWQQDPTPAVIEVSTPEGIVPASVTLRR
jgi:hypothetical protein